MNAADTAGSSPTPLSSLGLFSAYSPEESMLLVLLVVLVILALGGLPLGGGPFIPHQWGYAPSGIVFVIIVVLLVLLLAGRL